MYAVYDTGSGETIREFEESELAWAFLDILVMRGWNEEYLGVRYVY